MKEIKRNSDKAPSVDKVLRSWEQKGGITVLKPLGNKKKKPQVIMGHIVLAMLLIAALLISSSLPTKREK